MKVYVFLNDRHDTGAEKEAALGLFNRRQSRISRQRGTVHHNNIFKCPSLDFHIVFFVYQFSEL